MVKKPEMKVKRNILIYAMLLSMLICRGVNADNAQGVQENRLVINSGSRSWILDEAVTQNGRFLITGGEDNLVVIWDFELGRVVRTLTGHTGAVNAVAICSDETMFATAGGDKTVMIWNLSSGKNISRTLTGIVINDISFSPDGKLISATGSGSTFIIRVSDGEIIKKLPAGSFFTAFSSDGSSLYVGHALYDAARWQLIRKYHGNGDNAEHGELSRNGRMLILVAKNGHAVMIDTESGRVLWEKSGIRFNGRPAALYPDGSKVCLILDAGGIIECDALSGNILRTLKSSHSSSVEVLPDSSCVIASGRSGQFSVFDNDASVSRYILGARHSFISSASFEKKGTMLCLSNSRWVNSIDLESGVKRTIGNYKKNITGFDVSFDGQRTAAGYEDGMVKIYKTVEGSELFSFNGFFSGHSGAVRSAVFSPNGKYLVTCGDDKKVYLWDAEKGIKVRTLSGFFGGSGKYSSAVFNHDGTRVAVGDSRGTVTVWSVPDGDEIYSISAIRIRVDSVAWSSDGNLISAGGTSGELCIIDADTGNVIKRFNEHTKDVLFLCFSPDNEMMASAGEDNGIIVWNTASWKQMMKLEGHIGKVTSLSFRQDGAYLVSAAEDGAVRFWHMPDGASAGIYMETTGKGSITVLSDGRYDANEECINLIHWVSGMEVVPLQDFGQIYRVNNLLPLFFNEGISPADSTAVKPADGKAAFNVARHLFGKVYSVSDSEVIVAASADGLFKIRDKLFVMVDGEKVALEAVMVIGSTVKCRIAGKGKIAKGMPVFK